MAAGAGKLRFTVHSTSGEVRHYLLLPAAISQHVGEQSGLYRTQTIQLESCCFIALKHGAGRVPGTDPSSFCLDQALLQVCIHSDLPVRCRFCSYPQEVVLRLEEPAKLEQIQILSHEYKVKAALKF